MCEVNYTPSTPGSSAQSFRKFFKFQVVKPLDVKTKFYNAEVNFIFILFEERDATVDQLFILSDFVFVFQSDEVYLEAQIQNLTAGPICLEKVSLESSHLFTGEKSI